MTAGIGAHILTVNADTEELARTATLARVLKPESSSFVESLEEIGEFDSEIPTLVRLFGSSATQVLTWLKANGRVASEVAILGSADAILVSPGEPHSVVGVLPQALVSAIASSKQTFDQSGAVLLIGACDEVRGIAAGIARLGFKRIQIVDSDDRKSEQMVQILRKRIFGVSFEAISRDSLTQLPNESSLAVNLMNVSESAILEDASYLNFLKVGGLWIDWTSATVQLEYDDEIVNAGAHVFRADLIRAWREALLVQQLTGRKPDTKPMKKADVLVAELLEPAVPAETESKTDPS